MGRNDLLILWVEDDPNDVLLFRRAFKKAGVNPVHVCANGEDAIHYLKGEPPYTDRERFPLPNLVITDIKMPRASGLDLLRWLREHPECKILPVVMFTGSGQNEDVQRAYQLEANASFQKPIGLDQAVEIVGKILGYWREAARPATPIHCD
jgi:CheY-like chemotaxis protein